MLASVLSVAGDFVLDHPALLISWAGSLLLSVYLWLQRKDAQLLAHLESTPLLPAHPDACAVLERINQIAMGLAKTAYTVSLTDISKAPAFNESLATQIGRDTLAQVKSEFGVANVQKAAAVSGGEAGLVDHGAGVAKMLIKAPSGRAIVGVAPTPA